MKTLKVLIFVSFGIILFGCSSSSPSTNASAPAAEASADSPEALYNFLNQGWVKEHDPDLAVEFKFDKQGNGGGEIKVGGNPPTHTSGYILKAQPGNTSKVAKFSVYVTEKLQRGVWIVKKLSEEKISVEFYRGVNMELKEGADIFIPD